MRSENGDHVRFFDWVRDIKFLFGTLAGGTVSLTLVIVFLSEVLAAPELAREASQAAREAQRTATEATQMATENRAFYDRIDRTLRITFCTSPFDLSEYAQIQLECNSLVGTQD